MKTVLFVCTISVAVAGCSQGLGSTETGALTGGALGAGLGAIIGHESGHTGAGVAIGSAAGILAGGLLGAQQEQTETQLAERESRMREHEQVLEENRRLIAELRAKGADVRDTDRGVVVNLPDVLFDFNKASLTPAARATARDIAVAVKGVSDRDITVEGHTDAVGTNEYNLRLSKDRARSVADALVDNGVSSKRLYVRGLGESQPIASNTTSAGRQRNRRVEVVIEN